MSTAKATPRVDAAGLQAPLADGGELALLDVREELDFSRRHLLQARCIPLSRLELLIGRRVPRKNTRIVVSEDDAALAARACARLAELGYPDVSMFSGGCDAWEAAGKPVFSGVNVPSKAFGEFVEHHYGTPNVSADELAALIKSGADMRIFDSRPFEEFQLVSIPGATNVPGGELVYRFADLVPSPDTLVVVNCAGRTRSILGAQSLINAGVPNKVVALRDGTMGWSLAKHQPEHGQTRRYGELSAAAMDWGVTAAERVAKRFEVKFISAATLALWRKQADERSLYMLDVRPPEEYAAGHILGSVNAPGGQLVQATDLYVATLNARIVLLDPQRVRAVMTASWLGQMGWDVVVLEDGFDALATERGAGPVEVPGLDGKATEGVTPAELQALLAKGGATLVDLGNSRGYRKAHIPGAWFCIRSRLAEDLPKVPATGRLVFTSEDGALAQLACADALPASPGTAAYLRGGTQAWVAAGLPTAAGEDRMASPPADVWLRPYERKGDTTGAMAEYLEWEVNLISMIERDGTTAFKAY